MATMSNPQMGQQGNVQSGQQQQQQRQAQQGVGSPITNEAYDVLTALQSKLEGLEAYRKYSKDGGGQIWQELTQSDVKCVGTLVDELERLVKEGKFRLRSPGQAG